MNPMSVIRQGWMVVLLLGCAWQARPVVAGTAGDTRELIADPAFRRGFRVQACEPGKIVIEGELRLPDMISTPCWQLAQWTSRESLIGAAAQVLTGNAVSFRNRVKAVTIAPIGHADGDLMLAVNGGAEYGDHVRAKGEPWPHLLVAQRFTDPPTVADLRAADLHIETRLRSATKVDPEKHDPNLHAAQFQLFFSIQNLNRKSEGYGSSLYLGVPLYDSRWPTPKPFQAPDWQGKFIYTPASTVYTDRSMHGGEWVTIDADLLPLVRESLEAAWAKGFLAHSQSLSDYYISAMNLGWEVPGTLDVAAQVRNLSLRTRTWRALNNAPVPASIEESIYRDRQAHLRDLSMQSKSELYSTLHLLSGPAPDNWLQAEAGILKRIEIKRAHIAFFYMDIVLAYRLFAERFSPDGRATIKQFIEDSIKPGSFKYGCRFVHANDNWPFNGVSNMIIGGESVGRPDLVLEGISRLEHFLMMNQQLGVTSEYNSPTYNALSLYAVEAIADLAESLRARVTARVVAERLWLETAHRYHGPTRQLAAPHSRAYFGDTLGARSAMFYTLYPLLPAPPSLDSPGFAGVQHNIQTCPENTLIRHVFEPYHAAICLEKSSPYYVQARKFRPFRQEGDDTWPGGFFDTLTYMTATYAIGSAQRVFCGGHSTTPFQVHWTDSDDQNPGNTLFVRYRVDDAFPRTVGAVDHQFPENGIVHPVQHRNTTIVLYRPKLSMKHPNDAPSGVRQLCASVLVPRAEQLDAISIGAPGDTTAQMPAELDRTETVYLRDGDCYIAIRPLTATDLGRSATMRVEHRDSFLAVSVLNLDTTKPRKLSPDDLRSTRNGFVIDVGDRDEYGEFADFCRIIGEAHVTDDLQDGVRTVRYERPGRSMVVAQRLATHQYLARTFDGQEYDGPMLRTPHTVATLGDRIELGDAQLISRSGEAKFLTVEPSTGTYSVLYPFRWPFPLHLKTPHGELQCDGFRLGRIVYRPSATGTQLVVDCERAPRPLHVTRPKNGALTVIVNDEDVSHAVKERADGQLVISLPGNDEPDRMHAQLEIELNAPSIVVNAAGKAQMQATLRNVGGVPANEVVAQPFISGFARHYGCGTQRIGQLAPGRAKTVSWGLTGLPRQRPHPIHLAAGAENAATRWK